MLQETQQLIDKVSLICTEKIFLSCNNLRALVVTSRLEATCSILDAACCSLLLVVNTKIHILIVMLTPQNMLRGIVFFLIQNSKLKGLKWLNSFFFKNFFGSKKFNSYLLRLFFLCGVGGIQSAVLNSN